MIRYRKALSSDLEPLLDLIEKGFSVQPNSVNYLEGKAHRVLFSYLYTRPQWKPEYVWVAEENGRLIAAVGVFPQSLSFDGVYIQVWGVSPVVTDPEHRGKRAAVQCMEALLDDLCKSGVYAVFLWGIPDYYPKFGFVPILPRYQTRLTHRQLHRFQTHDGTLKEVGLEQLPTLQKLYGMWERKHWLQPLRTEKWWMERSREFNIEAGELKEVPFLKKENLRVWENSTRDITGYIYIQDHPDNHRHYIQESAAVDLATAKSMVNSVMDALPPEDTLVIRGTPDHYVNIAAYELGGTHVNPAPLAGMVKILDWDAFLRAMGPVFAQRIGSASIKSQYWRYGNDQESVEFEITGSGLKFNMNNCNPVSNNLNRKLTHLIFGVYNAEEFASLSGPGPERLMPLIFPRKYPFIWDANYLY